jgi:hypothetical protein
MSSKFRSTCLCAVSGLVLFIAAWASHAEVEKSWGPEGKAITKITANGFSTFVLLGDGSTNGFLNASRDRLTNTSALDFSYASLDESNPDLVILVQGAGEIPNSALTITATAAQLRVTTPFPVIRCEVSLETGSFVCANRAPVTFDLTWVKSGLGAVSEKTKRTQTFGPVTTRFRGEFTQVDATVNGTWEVFTATNLLGNLVDSKNNTLIREISVEVAR